MARIRPLVLARGIEARAITNSLRARFVINKVVDRMHGMLTSGI